MDLLTYFKTYEPSELKLQGNDRYTTKTHSSLVISKGKWIWNRERIGGVSALDYLIKVRGMGFVSAVEMLAGANYIPLPTQNKHPKTLEQEIKKELRLPRREQIPNSAIAYLQKRGIGADIIKSALNQGIIYESKYYNPKSEFHNEKVCVFIGKDEKSVPKFATMRGINKDFKRDATGSDKRFNFCIPSSSPDCSAVAVYESPIDAMSHMTLQELSGNDENIYRLSLGGTSYVALISFLEKHPKISQIKLCLDNDKAGREGAEIIRKLLAENESFSHIKTEDYFPIKVKDYNLLLLNELQIYNEEKPIRLNKKADIFI